MLARSKFVSTLLRRSCIGRSHNLSASFPAYLQLNVFQRGSSVTTANLSPPSLLRGVSSALPHAVPLPLSSPSLARLYGTESEGGGGGRGDYKLVYTGPLKGAMRAVKVFSLSTAVAALFGLPVLAWVGNPSVPMVARVALCSFVMLVGISTTAILHWLMKGYVIRMEYDEKAERVVAYTLSLTARTKQNEFYLTEARPPASTGAFSTFQANGKSYFLHTDVFDDKKLLSAILGPYMALEDTPSGSSNTRASSDVSK